MKFKAAGVESFLARPDPTIATVLLYGPDAGLVGERARRLTRTVVDDPGDPFRVSELNAEDLRTSPGRLVEEAQSLCMLGGRRLVRVRDAADAISPAVRDLLGLAVQEGFVLLEAGDLGGASSLRRLIEEAPKAAALPCYRDEDRGLASLVRALLTEHGLQAAPDAQAWLEAHLGGDRALTRAEIGKLALYVADQPGRQVSLEDVVAVVGDSSVLGLDDVVHAAVLGRRVELERSLDRLLAEGQVPVRLLRVAAAFLLRLLRLQGSIEAGGSIDAALAAARPPIFFRQRPVMAEALRRWPADALVSGLALLQAAEIRCKTAGAPDALICRAVFVQLGALAVPARH
ncbi:MAG: DNA polymerase III subunit delta [Geminicoccaceae bacterium]